LPDEIITDTRWIMRYDVPVFDPFRDRGDDYYHPGNEAATQLVQVGLIYRDIAKLFEMLNRLDDEYERKLLSKFVVVEWLSLDEHVNKLVGVILSGRTRYSPTREESEEVKRRYGEYTRSRKPHERALRETRNQVAAHRDPLSLEAIALIWDSLDAGHVLAIVRTVPALFECLKGLNVYCWTKSEQTERGKVIAFVRPLVWEGMVVEEDDVGDSGQQS
jgi:hypothetical protein